METSKKKSFILGFKRKLNINWDNYTIALNETDVNIPDTNTYETVYLNNQTLSLLNSNSETKLILQGM